MKRGYTQNLKLVQISSFLLLTLKEVELFTPSIIKKIYQKFPEMNPLKNKCIWVLCITAIVALATTTNAQICYLKTLEPVGFPSKCFKLTPEFQARLSDETSSESTDGISSIVLPLPNGEEVVLSVTYAPIMEAELRQRYPEIRSYKVSADGYSGRIGYTYKGFHGMLFTPNGTVYYDPLNQSTDDYYCYYRKDYTKLLQRKQRTLSATPTLSQLKLT